MREPKKATKARIKEVAVLRVEGVTWAAIAERYKYASADSACKQMTWEYRDLWQEEYEHADAMRLAEIEAKGVKTQLELMDCDDNNIRQRAAHSILAHCAKLRAQKVQVSGVIEHRTENAADAMATLVGANGKGNGSPAKAKRF